MSVCFWHRDILRHSIGHVATIWLNVLHYTVCVSFYLPFWRILIFSLCSILLNVRRIKKLFWKPHSHPPFTYCSCFLANPSKERPLVAQDYCRLFRIVWLMIDVFQTSNAILFLLFSPFVYPFEYQRLKTQCIYKLNHLVTNLIILDVIQKFCHVGYQTSIRSHGVMCFWPMGDKQNDCGALHVGTDSTMTSKKVIN